MSLFCKGPLTGERSWNFWDDRNIQNLIWVLVTWKIEFSKLTEPHIIHIILFNFYFNQKEFEEEKRNWQKLNTYHIDLEISFLGVSHVKETYVDTKSIQKFISALFIITKARRQTKYLSTDESINKLSYKWMVLSNKRKLSYWFMQQ